MSISANLPDVDFLPGLLIGNPRALHRGPSHSLMAALIAAGAGASLVTWSFMPWLTRAALIFLAYGSYVGLDYFTPGRGVLLGLLLRRRHKASPPWFLSVTFEMTSHGIWLRGGNQHFWWAIGGEALLISPGISVLTLAKGFSWLLR